MKGFKQHIKDNEDIEKSLAKLPKAYRKLVHGFHIELEPNNTLKGDDGHVGVVMTNPKRCIKVSGPWHYSREFCLFHEIGHLVFSVFCTEKWKKEWDKVCKLNPNRKKDEPNEENWCHSFASFFTKHSPTTHSHPAWEAYMDKFCKATGK